MSKVGEDFTREVGLKKLMCVFVHFREGVRLEVIRDVALHLSLSLTICHKVSCQQL